jgi:hypothetical protein
VSNKVNKSLSQEEMTIVNNIQSLIAELKSATGAKADDMGQERMGQPVIQKPEQISEKATDQDEKDDSDVSKTDDEDMDDKDDDKDEAPEMVSKDQTNTPSDVATARDKAEDRLIDSLSEVDVENMDEVKKAIKKIKVAKKALQLRKSVNNSEVASSLHDLAVVVKAVIDNQSQQELALKNILEGLGITKQLELVNKSEPANGKPIMTNDNTNMATFLTSLAKQITKSETPANDKGQTVLSNGQIVQKNLNGMMNSLFANIPGRK